MNNKTVAVCLFTITGMLYVSGISAQETDRSETDSLDDIALELYNPASSLFSVFNEFEFHSYQGDLPGASDQTNWMLTITPSFPITLDNGKNIIIRASIPIDFGIPTYPVPGRDYVDWGIRQDADTISTNSEFFSGHGFMGDISYDVAYGGVNDNGWITMYGIAGVLPTGQDGSIERDQYLLGPEFAFGKYTSWGIIGAWARHLVDVADVSSRDDITWNTSETIIDVFFAYSLGNGWQIISTPTIVYDWEAASGNEWQIPIGGGVSKTTRWWKTPVKMDLELDYYIESPEAFGTEWLLKFSITPVFSDRRG